MARVALVIGVLTLASAGAALAACVSSTNAPPGESLDSGPFTNDATLPFDAGGPADAAPDTTAPPTDAGTDAPLSCGSWTPYLAFDASDWDGAPLSVNASNGAPLPGPVASYCGEVSATTARLYILNSSPCSLDVWWSDWVCDEDFYGTIPPGDIWHINSYSGTVWRIRAPGTEDLLEEIPPLPAAIDDAGAAPATVVQYPPSGSPVDAAAYPPAPEANPDAAACVGWDAAVEYDAGDWDGALSPLADDAGFLPGPPATVCSGSASNQYVQMFVDNTSCPIDVYWVDYACNENYWETIEQGRNNVADTYALSVWRLRAHGSNQLLAQAPIVPDVPDAGNAVLRYP